MKIGITGAAGMIGWHLRCHLKQFGTHEVILATRDTFCSEEALANFVACCDAVVHLAGVNRGPDENIANTNPNLAKTLTDACDKSAVTPHIVYASTTHADSDSVYGKSKRQAGDILEAWSKESGAQLSIAILPHVFGEGTRPFYNSAVATFAYQLAIGEEPEIHNDAELELIHAQDVCAELVRLLERRETGSRRLTGERIRVSAALRRLRGLAESYNLHIVPDVRTPLDLRLLNLYRSYLFPKKYPRYLERKTDERGHLVEAIKNHNGGQAFFSTTKPGITRGNHFHFHKIERFLVVEGSATIRIRRLFDTEVHAFEVRGDVPAYIDMPPLHTHNITNTGDRDLLTLFWAHEIFDPDSPDTIAEPV